MRILVIGSGAREHALARALDRDSAVREIHLAPGNAGTAQLGTNHAVPATDADGLTALALDLQPDLTIIGPEAPLVAGVADRLRAAGFDVFGPSAAAARIEGSKAFAKEVMAAAGVPTGRAIPVTDPDRIDTALDTTGAPYVVKDDGLAAGKGVVVTSDRDEARAHAAAVLAAGRPVLVEQFLDGPEVSLLAVCDGTRAVPLLPAQDFKRVGDGDTGPNTGGMGAYAPLPWAPAGLVDDVQHRIIEPVLTELGRRNARFVGILYAGLAITADGPQVIEFNCRFGDPETQVVLELLDTPLAGLLRAAARGELDTAPSPRWREGAAVTVVIASENYPASPVTGRRLAGPGIETAHDVPPRHAVLHAGTSRSAAGQVVSSGGRVLSVTATGDDLAAARDAAYRLVDRISLDGSHHRRDIADAAIRGTIVIPS